MQQKQYKINLKPPKKRSTIWGGPDHQTGTIPVAEDDRAKTRREAVGNRLEALTGEKPKWQKRGYYYLASLDEDHVAVVATWYGVRSLQEIK